MDTADTIVVSVLKYDGVEHRRWPARIARTEGSLLVLDAVFDEEIEHDQVGTISAGTISTEFYWLDRWYNIFRFGDATGRLRNFYCNVNQPPRFEGRVLSYVDLDIDVLVEPDFSYRVLDLEDFEINARRYVYPNDVRDNARRALDELTQMIRAKVFPFNE